MRFLSKMLARTITLLLLLTTSAAGIDSAYAQQPDSLSVLLPDSAHVAQTDSSQTAMRKPYKPLRFFQKNYPDPRKAVLLAAVLPGAGQAYNKKWWKLPLVYGALGGMAWWTYDNATKYSEYSINYKALVDEDPNTQVTNPLYEFVPIETLKDTRDRFRKYTEQSYLALGLLYLLSVTDAYVDAQLHGFDVSDDLSLHLVPASTAAPGGGTALGLGLRLSF